MKFIKGKGSDKLWRVSEWWLLNEVIVSMTCDLKWSYELMYESYGLMLVEIWCLPISREICKRHCNANKGIKWSSK